MAGRLTIAQPATGASPENSGAPAAPSPRTVIHGIGSQRPLQTLRNAADAIYASDPGFHRQAGGKDDPDPWPDLWLTFDRDVSERDVGLPMLTTPSIAGAGQPPHYVGFQECYWAHLVSETRLVAVPLWLFELIRKGPWAMQPGIRPLWPAITVASSLWLAAFAFLALTAAGWATATANFGAILGPVLVWGIALAAAFTLSGRNRTAAMLATGIAAWGFHVAPSLLGLAPAPATMLPYAPGDRTDTWVALGFVASFALINTFVLLTIVGDAARYYRAAPGNIAVRRAARKLAVDRLRALHDGAHYDRVVVGHSLGTVIGYDMLRADWSEINHHLGDPHGHSRFDVQDAAGAKGAPFDPAAWRNEKPGLLAAMAGLPRRRPDTRWIVSNFVTLGSPLTHARFLMADGNGAAALAGSFRRKRLARELPQDPAWHVGGEGWAATVPSGGRAVVAGGGRPEGAAVDLSTGSARGG